MIYKLKYLLLGLSVISKMVKLNPEEVNTNITLNGNGLVLIGNEGNFQNGNASLSSYNINTQQTTYNIYQAINQELIGDVLHSIYHSDHLLYLVVNNSGKIIAIDDESLEKKMEIRNLVSPRKIIKVDNSKFYISDLYASEVTVYNNYDGAVGKIPVDGWCEDIIIQNGKAYISNITNNQLYVVNTSNDNIFDSILVGSNPISIKDDSRGIFGFCVKVI